MRVYDDDGCCGIIPKMLSFGKMTQLALTFGSTSAVSVCRRTDGVPQFTFMFVCMKKTYK